MHQPATKLVIVTEKLVQREILKIVEGAGASGYRIQAVDGKGSRNARSSGPAVSHTFSNIKVEVITSDSAVAKRIADEVAAKYFGNYSGSHLPRSSRGPACAKFLISITCAPENAEAFMPRTGTPHGDLELFSVPSRRAASRHAFGRC